MRRRRRKEEDAEEEAAGAELKTKTPHKDVGKNAELGFELEPVDFVQGFGNLNALPMCHYAGLLVTLYQRACRICSQICWLRAGLEWHIFFRDAGRGSGEFRLQQ